jgi:hypothetical protein
VIRDRYFVHLPGCAGSLAIGGFRLTTRPMHSAAASPSPRKFPARATQGWSAIVLKCRGGAEPQQSWGACTIPWKWFLAIFEKAWQTRKSLDFYGRGGVHGDRLGWCRGDSNQHHGRPNSAGDKRFHVVPLSPSVHLARAKRRRMRGSKVGQTGPAAQSHADAPSP